MPTRYRYTPGQSFTAASSCCRHHRRGFHVEASDLVAPVGAVDPTSLGSKKLGNETYVEYSCAGSSSQAVVSVWVEIDRGSLPLSKSFSRVSAPGPPPVILSATALLAVAIWQGCDVSTTPLFCLFADLSKPVFPSMGPESLGGIIEWALLPPSWDAIFWFEFDRYRLAAILN